MAVALPVGTRALPSLVSHRYTTERQLPGIVPQALCWRGGTRDGTHDLGRRMKPATVQGGPTIGGLSAPGMEAVAEASKEPAEVRDSPVVGLS
jgi:hypothetical protein